MSSRKLLRARGVKLGPKFKLDEYDILEAHRQLHQENKTLNEIADRLRVSQATVKRGFERMELADV